MSSISQTSLDKIAPFQASKWLHYALLCEVMDLQHLLSDLGEKKIVSLAGVIKENSEIISENDFLDKYAAYLEMLKNGQEIAPSQLHRWFTSGITLSLNHFCKVPVGERENLVRIVKPVLQIKPHWFDYSETDNKVRSDTLSLSNISWGLQFSYPQIFEDPETKKIHKVLGEEAFPNNSLFRLLQKWIRENSRATPFLMGAKKINAPIRITKACMPWINRHKGLIIKGMSVNV